MKQYMQRILVFGLTLVILVLWSSCRKDFNFEPSNGTLTFSKDTVYLDTVFTNIGSSTYNLKVYNRSDRDIVIPTLRLGQGQNSNYRLNVDGLTGEGPIAGKEFTDVELLANDSMYIFIETTIDIQDLVSSDTQFLYTDQIEFDAGNNLQTVDLVTLVKDAHFIFPSRFIGPEGETIIETLTFDIDGDGIDDETTIQGRFLTGEELIFTNEKPYVIYGYAAVDENQTLTIDAGARVHFHANSGLLVTNNASLVVNGAPSTDAVALENEVIFEGDRLEPSFAEVPGQWQTIWLFNGSTGNLINHATIKNGTVGILSDGNQINPNKLVITNSQIYNSSNFGILGRATNIYGENVVINNSGQSSLAGTIGGRYNFVHSTIANYWTNSFRQFPALLLNNFVLDEDLNVTVNPLEEANFTNCIIYGNDNPELLLDRDTNSDFNFKFTNSLLRFDNSSGNFDSPLYDFNNIDLYENLFRNIDPEFLDPSANKLQIANGSIADGVGINFGILNVDITGTTRETPSDLGAYESSDFPEDD